MLQSTIGFLSHAKILSCLHVQCIISSVHSQDTVVCHLHQCWVIIMLEYYFCIVCQLYMLLYWCVHDVHTLMTSFCCLTDYCVTGKLFSTRLCTKCVSYKCLPN